MCLFQIQKNTQSAEFNFTGHTPFLQNVFGANDVVMLMTSENLKVGLVTEHLPLSEVTKFITREAIISKLNILIKLVIG